jgi:hypothetical protein
MFARWTVNFVLNGPIVQPTKKHAAMLHKVIRNRFLCKLTAKFVTFSFQLTVGFLKPFVFLLETLKFFPSRPPSGRLSLVA